MLAWEGKVAVSDENTGVERVAESTRGAEREGASAGAKAPGTIADLERGLFGDDDEEADAGGEAAADEGAAAGAADEAAKPPPAQQGLGYSDDSEDEMDDFIVRDETDGPRETKEERQRRYASAIPGLRRDQLQDAADIFGDTDELHRMFAARNRTGGAKEDVVEELSEDEESDGDELDTFIEKDGATEEDYEQAKAASDARKAAKAARKSAGRKSSGGETKDWASQTFEPSVIKEQMLTAKDDAIRAQDLPERQQLKPRPAHAPTDWGMEAMWIFDRIMGRDSIQNKPTVEGYSLLYGVAEYENENDRDAFFFASARRSAVSAVTAQTQKLPPVGANDLKNARLAAARQSRVPRADGHARLSGCRTSGARARCW